MKTCSTENLNAVRQRFDDCGVSIAEWARLEGFSPNLVYQVLDGRSACIRGECHRIAVALGLKAGNRLSARELAAELAQETQTRTY